MADSADSLEGRKRCAWTTPNTELCCVAFHDEERQEMHEHACIHGLKQNNDDIQKMKLKRIVPISILIHKGKVCKGVLPNNIKVAD